MNMNSSSHDSSATLDPPGTIAVIGGGVLGVEAALYGRFLGYSVTLIEAKTIGSSAEHLRDNPLPVLPDRCLSPLAISALSTQVHESGPQTLPTTVGQWIDDGLVALTLTDLLRGRVMTGTQVISIQRVPVELEDDELEDDDDETDLPPDDFRLQLKSNDGQTSTLDVEALILATGNDDSLHQLLPESSDYLFRIGGGGDGTWNNIEAQLRSGYQQIVDVFALLGGRETLDLYRPRRL
jgi:hypothetical protein